MYQAAFWKNAPDLSYPAIILSASIPVVVDCVPYFRVVVWYPLINVRFPFHNLLDCLIP